MNNYFIILAAGKGQRFKQNKPKQFFNYNGKMLINHSIDKALESKLFKKIVIVASKKYKKYFKKYRKNKILIVNGGKERKDSSLLINPTENIITGILKTITMILPKE